MPYLRMTSYYMPRSMPASLGMSQKAIAIVCRNFHVVVVVAPTDTRLWVVRLHRRCQYLENPRHDKALSKDLLFEDVWNSCCS